MSLIDSTSKKTAIVFSYLALFLNTVYAIFLTPILLRKLGVDEYGLYQMVYSVGHYILILDLGIGTVMVRYISEYRAKKDKQGEENFAAMMFRIVMAIATLIVVAGCVVDANIENIFKDLTSSDYIKSHQMMRLMVVQMAMVVVAHYFTGIISAYERFTFIKIASTLRIIVSFALTVGLVNMGLGAVGIVLASVALSLCMFTIYIFYVKRILHFRSRFYFWDKVVLKPMVGLSLAMLLQSVIGMANTSADKTILGIMCSKRDVAMYSIGASVVTMFNSLPTVISGMFQPEVMRIIVKDNSTSRLTDLVIRVGRWQFILTGAMLVGFVLFGADFMQLWVGNEMMGALWVILIILPFNMIPLVQTVCLSILNGYNKRLYRSIILVSMCVFKIFITIVLIKYIGIWGAPVGTALSYLIGHCILMNIYYSRNIHLEVGRMFRGIFKRTWLVLLATSGICSPLLLWQEVSLVSFFVKVATFCIIYFLLLLFWGFNKEEKEIVQSYISKRTH